MLREGMIVDATIIAAPSSIKNEKKERDPEMHQVKKGNEWHFGMKMHIGVDDALGLIHSLETTAANAADINLRASCCTAMKRWCGVTRATRGSTSTRSTAGGQSVGE
ncbi:MAG: transposase [Parahaliea sp.]